MFPLWYLLVPYGIFLLFMALFVFFNLYHIASFGLQSAKTTVVLVAYMAGFLGILWLSYITLADVSWKETVDLRTIIHAPSFAPKSGADNDL